MRINHVFIYSVDVEKSTRFYCELMGFAPTRKFNDGGGDSQIVHRESHGSDLDLLIVPFGSSKLPFAQHFAFEVDSITEFEFILETAKTMGLNPRSDVPLDSKPGVSTFSTADRTYQHFYVLDPSRANIEIMWRGIVS